MNGLHFELLGEHAVFSDIDMDASSLIYAQIPKNERAHERVKAATKVWMKRLRIIMCDHLVNHCRSFFPPSPSSLHRPLKPSRMPKERPTCCSTPDLGCLGMCVWQGTQDKGGGGDCAHAVLCNQDWGLIAPMCSWLGCAGRVQVCRFGSAE